MLSVSDMLKILDQVPIWNTLSKLPKQLAAMEERVKLLESQYQVPPSLPGEPCAACGGRSLRRTSRVPAAEGNFLIPGRFDEVWTCERCSKTEARSLVK